MLRYQLFKYNELPQQTKIPVFQLGVTDHLGTDDLLTEIFFSQMIRKGLGEEVTILLSKITSLAQGLDVPNTLMGNFGSLIRKTRRELIFSTDNLKLYVYHQQTPTKRIILINGEENQDTTPWPSSRNPSLIFSQLRKRLK